MNTYITGLTALNLLIPGRPPAGWHTHGLVNQENWCWAGVKLASTEHLLGDQNLYDATSILRRYSPDIPDGTLAASYERAVFDLLYHFLAVKQKPVPNIQSKDIDDAVDFSLVAEWIKFADLSQDQRASMFTWLNVSETFYVHQNQNLMSQIATSRGTHNVAKHVSLPDHAALRSRLPQSSESCGRAIGSQRDDEENSKY